jgi:hypothetical protein
VTFCTLFVSAKCDPLEKEVEKKINLYKIGHNILGFGDLKNFPVGKLYKKQLKECIVKF